MNWIPADGRDSLIVQRNKHDVPEPYISAVILQHDSALVILAEACVIGKLAGSDTCVPLAAAHHSGHNPNSVKPMFYAAARHSYHCRMPLAVRNRLRAAARCV